MFTIVDEDIFSGTERYLCHQCNCVTTRSAYMAKSVFDKFPYADVYTQRTTPDKPGTIEVRDNGLRSRRIVNMFGQYYPGKPRYPNSPKDGFGARIKYFRRCLYQMSQLLVGPNVSFAFPWRIGCGAAGGDWGRYIEILKDFESHINKDDIEANVVIYKLPKDTQ